MGCSSKHLDPRENLHVTLTKDRDMLAEDSSIPVAFAWDKNDMNPVQRFVRATNGGYIAPTGHYVGDMGTRGKTFAPEREWTPQHEVDIDDVLHGGDRRRDVSLLRAWKDKIFVVLGCRVSHPNAERDEESCSEADLRKVLDPHTSQVTSEVSFIQPGSTKSSTDNELALERLRKIMHTGVRGTRRRALGGGRRDLLLHEDAEAGKPGEVRVAISAPWGVAHHALYNKCIDPTLMDRGHRQSCATLRGNDKHAAAGTNYRRRHHFITVAYEELWCLFLEMYQRDKEAEELARNQAGEGAEGTEGVEGVCST